eukprot:2770253-Pyramimonas_sp.AAC.1
MLKFWTPPRPLFLILLSSTSSCFYFSSAWSPPPPLPPPSPLCALGWLAHPLPPPLPLLLPLLFLLRILLLLLWPKSAPVGPREGSKRASRGPQNDNKRGPSGASEAPPCPRLRGYQDIFLGRKASGNHWRSEDWAVFQKRGFKFARDQFAQH